MFYIIKDVDGEYLRTINTEENINFSLPSNYTEDASKSWTFLHFIVTLWKKL